MERLAKRQANCAVEPETLRKIIDPLSIIDLDLDNENIFLDPKNILVYITNFKVKFFLIEGGISKYPCKNCPLLYTQNIVQLVIKLQLMVHG